MGNSPGAKTEGRGIGIAGLNLKAGPIDGAAVEARRRTGLEAAAAQAKLLQRFAEQHGGWLSGASCRILLFTAVDEAVEESAGGNNDSGGADGASVAQADT